MDKVYTVPDGYWYPKAQYAIGKDHARRWWHKRVCMYRRPTARAELVNVLIYDLQQMYKVDYCYAKAYVDYQVDQGVFKKIGDKLSFTSEGIKLIRYLEEKGVTYFRSLKPILTKDKYHKLFHSDVPRVEPAFNTYLFDHYLCNDNQVYHYQLANYNDGLLDCVPADNISNEYKLTIHFVPIWTLEKEDTPQPIPTTNTNPIPEPKPFNQYLKD